MYTAFVSVFLLSMFSKLDEFIGQRPYELDWAGRYKDDHEPIIDFEDLTGWYVQTRDVSAEFSRTREQQLWDKYVGKLTYRATGQNPLLRIFPPQPIKIDRPFDAVTCWIYGNNWAWSPDPTTPQVIIRAIFRGTDGSEISVYLDQVNWKEWFLVHRRLTPDQINAVKNGSEFICFEIENATNTEDRVLYFDNLAVFVEEFPPLTFEPRPERGIPMFPGQGVGTNTGPGKLPFPTRLETILPDNLTSDFKISLSVGDGEFIFVYDGSDGKLTYRIKPQTGTFSDITAQWEGVDWLIYPCFDGGVYLFVNGKSVKPERAEHKGSFVEDGAVKSKWLLISGGKSVEVTYTYRLMNKSLIIEVVAPGGDVSEVRYGYAKGLQNPRLVTNPFYMYGWTRPAVVVAGPSERPLFLTGNTDWCLSNSSIPWAENAITEDGVFYNGGTKYIPKTDGRRNDCYERFFITISTRYEEVLPNIPNPVSPWKHITGTHVWRAHGVSVRENDIKFWTHCHRYGMTEVVITDHETMWRDGGESFTFRTKAAPGKGGDEGQYNYTRILQDKLGFVYGPYNNFTDFAPVNEFWNIDMVSRTPDNQLQHAWARCYAPKPARAVEFCQMLAPKIQEKFKFSTAYCDVHTAVAPWDRVDYDYRVPGAGTFIAVFYSFGEIMLLQKSAWNGPVYSEGNRHYMYCGLTDGNYAQDQQYKPAVNPWLVDFDLRKMHDLCCNFGMGNLEMFYAGERQMGNTKEEMDEYIDRFLAATIAFGHTGFLVFEGGLQNALRSYYMLQQLHSRYALSSVQDIRYLDDEGNLLDTTMAVSTGAYKRSQIVTRYKDGCITVVNGNRTERMVVRAYGHEFNLPPNGYAGWTEDGTIYVISSDEDGHRYDYAETPAYIYIDGRGKFIRCNKAGGDGIGICRSLEDDKYEIILYNNSKCGFAIDASKAYALDEEGNKICETTIYTSEGLTFVVPVVGAFSYIIER